MAIQKIENAKFAYGDVLEISKTAPEEYHTNGRIGVVCGIDIVHSVMQQERFSQSMGEVLYLLEFSDGSSLEISEHFLKNVDNPS
ncbi:MAG: hypothetical protein ABJO67_14910 [Pseudoruegeria sp.]